MLAFLVVVTLGLAIGFARGGRLRNVSGAHLALLPLVWTAAGLQVAAQFVPLRWSIVAYGLIVVSYAALFSFAGANWRVPGMLFIALGAALNYTVILANQGMPISAEAAAHAGFAGSAGDLVLRGKHFVTSGDDARLMFLGDVIPLWRQPAVASVGDVILWAGLILLIQDLTLAKSRKRPRARRGDTARAVIDLTDPQAERTRGGAGADRTPRTTRSGS